jgi:hypothetical protein
MSGTAEIGAKSPLVSGLRALAPSLRAVYRRMLVRVPARALAVVSFLSLGTCVDATGVLPRCVLLTTAHALYICHTDGTLHRCIPASYVSHLLYTAGTTVAGTRGAGARATDGGGGVGAWVGCAVPALGDLAIQALDAAGAPFCRGTRELLWAIATATAHAPLFGAASTAGASESRAEERPPAPIAEVATLSVLLSGLALHGGAIVREGPIVPLQFIAVSTAELEEALADPVALASTVTNASTGTPRRLLSHSSRSAAEQRRQLMLPSLSPETALRASPQASAHGSRSGVDNDTRMTEHSTVREKYHHGIDARAPSEIRAAPDGQSMVDDTHLKIEVEDLRCPLPVSPSKPVPGLRSSSTHATKASAQDATPVLRRSRDSAASGVDVSVSPMDDETARTRCPTPPPAAAVVRFTVAGAFRNPSPSPQFDPSRRHKPNAEAARTFVADAELQTEVTREVTRLLAGGGGGPSAAEWRTHKVGDRMDATREAAAAESLSPPPHLPRLPKRVVQAPASPSPSLKDHHQQQQYALVRAPSQVGDTRGASQIRSLYQTNFSRTQPREDDVDLYAAPHTRALQPWHVRAPPPVGSQLSAAMRKRLDAARGTSLVVRYFNP